MILDTKFRFSCTFVIIEVDNKTMKYCSSYEIKINLMSNCTFRIGSLQIKEVLSLISNLHILHIYGFNVHFLLFSWFTVG